MKSRRKGSLVFLTKFLTALFILSLIYHLLTAFMIPSPLMVYPTCVYYSGGLHVDEFNAYYFLLHSRIANATVSGVLLGALIGLELATLLTKPWKPPRSPKFRWILLGLISGAALGAFLFPFHLRWFFWGPPVQIWLRNGFSCDAVPGPTFYIDMTYIHWLGIILLLALLVSISTKTRSTTTTAYRFGCRN